jgi:hypothetical protein
MAVLNVGDARAVVCGEYIAPGQARSPDRSLAKIDYARFDSLRRSYQGSSAAHAVAEIHHLDGGFLRAGRQTGRSFGLEGECQVRGGWQAMLQVQREAVSRKYIETGSWQEHDPACLCLGIPPRDSLVNRNLAGDIQVMCPGLQTGINHWLRGIQIRAGAVQHEAISFSALSTLFGFCRSKTRHSRPNSAARGSILAASRPARTGRSPISTAMRAAASPT